MQYVLFNPQAGNGSGAQQARALDARFPEETFSYTDMTTISDYAAWLGTLRRMRPLSSRAATAR